MEINLVNGIAALLYYRKPLLKEDGVTPVQFEQLIKAEQSPYLDEALDFLTIIDKLNFVIVPRKQEEEGKDKQKLSDADGIRDVTKIIKDFIAGLNKRQDVHSNMIQWDGLARAIWNGGGR